MKRKIAMVIPTVLLMAGCQTIRPSAPANLPDEPIIVQPLPPSYIDIPITLDVTHLFDSLNKSIPNEDYSDHWPEMDASADCRLQYKWFFRRSPFAFQLSGNVITMSSIGSFAAEAKARPCCGKVCPWVSVGCGTDTQPVTVNIGLSSSSRLANNYDLKTVTSLSGFVPADPCFVPSLRFNVADQMAARAESKIKTAVEEFDHTPGQINLRYKIEPIWKILFRPIPINSVGFIVLNPSEVRVSKLSGDGHNIGFSVGLTARPNFTLTQPDFLASLPVPDLSSTPPGNGFTIYIDGKLDYAPLSALLNQELNSIGKIPFDKTDYIVLSDAEVFGVGNSKLFIRVNINGKAEGVKCKGWLYFWGTTSYNITTGELSFSNLDYYLKTNSIPVHFANWLLASALKQKLQEKAKWNISSVLEKIKLNANAALNKEISTTIKLDGKVVNLNMVGFQPLKEYLLVRVKAEGQLSLKVL
jgi:hypothetical protein